MVRKKEKEDFVPRRELEFIWDQVRDALEKLNENQIYLNASQKVIMKDPNFFNRGSAM